MKRFRSCFGILALGGLGLIAALFAFSIFFQQSQAVASNGTATIVARFTATPRPPPTSVPPPQQPAPQTDNITSHDTSIIITDAPAPTAAPPDAQSTSFATPSGTPPGTPRYSGTSSYPLTVTAQVRMAQTNVAKKQANIAGTYTAIAIESEFIYATLTARAPTPRPKGK